MNTLKGLWRLGLCTLFVIGFSCGLAKASEPVASEKALHEIQETQQEHQTLEMKGEAQEEAQEMQEEAQEIQGDIEKELHKTEHD